MEAKMPEKPHSTAFHLEMQHEMDQSILESMLKKAGIPARAVRTVTPLQDGISFTHLLAEGEWNQGSGAADCDGRCQDRDLCHIQYQDLSPEQRQEFHQDLAQGMDYYRTNLYSLSDGCFQEMDDVAMSECGEDEDESETGHEGQRL